MSKTKENKEQIGSTVLEPINTEVKKDNDSKKQKELEQPDKASPDYADWIEYVKLRHARRIQNLQTKLIILAALLAAVIIFVGDNKNIIVLLLFGFVMLSTIWYIDERLALDGLEKRVYKDAPHTEVLSINSWRSLATSLALTIYFCFIAYIILATFGIFNIISPSTSSPAAYLILVGYNQTLLPNMYHITIKNLGTLPSQSFALTIVPNNSSVKIESVSSQYLGVTQIPIYQNQYAYVEVNSIPSTNFGDVQILLTSPSRITLKVESSDRYCSTVLYGLNNSGNITDNTIYTGDCNATVLGSILYTTFFRLNNNTSLSSNTPTNSTSK